MNKLAIVAFMALSTFAVVYSDTTVQCVIGDILFPCPGSTDRTCTDSVLQCCQKQCSLTSLKNAQCTANDLVAGECRCKCVP